MLLYVLCTLQVFIRLEWNNFNFRRVGGKFLSSDTRERGAEQEGRHKQQGQEQHGTGHGDYLLIHSMERRR